MARSRPAPELIQQLRTRVRQMERAGTSGDGDRRTLPTHPALEEVVRLHPGSSYRSDSASLAMALLAGPSAAGEWTAVVGVDDFGLEAADALGVDLERTIWVPDPGEHWVETTAALVEVTTVVLLRPPGPVTGHTANRIGARLRTHATALVVQGPWPRCEARLDLEQPRWSGVEQGQHGHGHLRSRRAELVVRRGAGPELRVTVSVPAEDAALRRDIGVVPVLDEHRELREVG